MQNHEMILKHSFYKFTLKALNKIVKSDILQLALLTIFQRMLDFAFHVNRLLDRQFT